MLTSSLFELLRTVDNYALRAPFSERHLVRWAKGGWTHHLERRLFPGHSSILSEHNSSTFSTLNVNAQLYDFLLSCLILHYHVQFLKAHVAKRVSHS